MTENSIEQALSVLEAAEAKLSPEQLGRLTEITKAHEAIRESVTDTLEAEEKRELSPEQADQLLGTLKSRFEASDDELRKAIDFAVVEKSLRAAPEKLYALYKLEETGGEPQVIGIEGDEFIFEDRSKESPTGRRNMDFDKAAAQAEDFGADMQSPEAYKAMQKTGKYDLKSASWLKTDKATLEAGFAMNGYRNVDDVYVFENHAANHDPRDGWRASLRVKKA